MCCSIECVDDHNCCHHDRGCSCGAVLFSYTCMIQICININIWRPPRSKSPALSCTSNLRAASFDRGCSCGPVLFTYVWCRRKHLKTTAAVKITSSCSLYVSQSCLSFCVLFCAVQNMWLFAVGWSSSNCCSSRRVWAGATSATTYCCVPVGYVPST